MLNRLGELRALGRPLLVGTSRKSHIGLVLGTPVEDRLEGTAATVTLAIAKGADIVRVHDVWQMARVVKMTDAGSSRLGDSGVDANGARESHMTPDFGSYEQALAWLYAFSNTERTGSFSRDREDNLARERALLAELGHPERAYGVTHIAGTKGKGSTATMVAAILRASGHSDRPLHSARSAYLSRAHASGRRAYQ